jgi:type II secretory pathway pseudopilin PulG
MTLVELVIVLAIIVLAALIGLPALQKMIVRANLESAAEQMAGVLRQARLEAVRRSAPAVVTFDTATRQLSAFVDLNTASVATGYRGSDLLFNPEAAVGLPDNARDFIVVQMQLSAKVRPGGPPADAAAVDGFTDSGAGQRVVVFGADGAVRDVGAYRINDDTRDPAGLVRNFLAVRVSPATTARVQLLKWNEADAAWVTRDMKNGKATWEWY